MNTVITFEENPSADNIQLLYNGIARHAKLKKDHKPLEFFGYFIRDENTKIVGGCNCVILYGCLQIDTLWVAEELRGQEYGSQLMHKAEETGKARGCTFATVNTMDWEALEFYQKLDYKIEFQRKGFEKESVFYFLRKEFSHEND